ncbi:hypothetical protein ACFYNY_25050 [Streptomyces sp. NPDC006530]
MPSHKVTSLLTRTPDRLYDRQRALHDQLTAAWREMTALADRQLILLN